MSVHDLTRKFLKVEGHNIAYLEAGEGSPLVLLHGIPTSSLLWREVIPPLARSHRFIVAVRHPERLNRLVLLSAVCFDSWPFPEFEPLQEPVAESAMSVSGFDAMLRDFLPQGVAAEEGLSDAATGMMLRPWSGEAGKAALFRKAPGRRDPQYSAGVDHWWSALDHWIMEEHVGDVAARIEAFLSAPLPLASDKHAAQA